MRAGERLGRRLNVEGRPLRTDDAILAAIDKAFGSVTRPERFTMADGDPETMDHEALLSTRDFQRAATTQGAGNPLSQTCGRPLLARVRTLATRRGR